METTQGNNLINLEPFIHQVGGHSSMLCLDACTVCKPLVPRELEFYETLPELLRKFTPKFYGVIQVRIIQDEDGYLTFSTRPPDTYKPKDSSVSRGVRLRRSGSIEIKDDKSLRLFLEDQSDKSNSTSKESAFNPWVFKCHRTYLQSLSNQKNSEPSFILLENLTWRFTYPCILDLKMGTRQYGDTANLKKRQSKTMKVVTSTSGKLGVRIGGMQVYQVTSERFLCRNKFFGRSLTVGGFQQALRQFLHNGLRLRMDVLKVLVRRLEELISVVSSTEAIRFYTTSLLLLYEGEVPDGVLHDGPTGPLEEEPPEISSHGLSRRSSSVETLSPLLDISTFDYAVLNSSMASSQSVFEENESPSLSRSPSTRRRRSSSEVGREEVKFPVKLNPSKSDKNHSQPYEPLVDVRIIDFAHVTYRGVDDPVVYQGPDQGFLFGLENMISILRNIEREYS